MWILGGLTEAQAVLMLAAEDDCLGIDFNPTASAINQVFRPSTVTLCKSFEAALRALDNEERKEILDNPGNLVWLYTGAFCQAFACHLELYRREWRVLYEPHANTSAVYGDAGSRNHVRKHAKEYSLHLQYINRSLDNMRRLIPRETNPDRWGENANVSELKKLINDFEHFAEDLGALKTACDQFLEQQVSKISLYEARMSMQEARDLNRLSYLGFVFVPLSLSSSFFSTNIEPLGGKTPLWIFIVTSLAILAFSLLVLLLTSLKMVREWFERAQDFSLNALQWSKERLGRGTAREDGKEWDADKYVLPLAQPQRPLASQSKFKILSTTASIVAQPDTDPPTESLKQPQQPPNRIIISSASVSNTAVTAGSSMNPTNHTARPSPSQHSPNSKRPSSQESPRPRVPMSDRTRRSLAKRPPMSSPVMPRLREEYRDPPRTARPDTAPRQSSAPVQYPAQHRPTKRRAASGGETALKSRSVSTIPKSPPHPSPCDGDQVSASQNETAQESKPTRALEEKLSNLLSTKQAKYKHNRTILHQAAHSGDQGLVQQLLDAGAYIDKIDDKHMTALDLAAKKGHTAVVQLLLERGAMPLNWHVKPLNTLAIAASKRQEAVLRILMGWRTPNENGADGMRDVSYTEQVKRRMLVDGFHYACKGGDTTAIQPLIQASKGQGCNFDEEYGNGLHDAAFEGVVDAVPLFKNAIADPELRLRSLNKALIIAADARGDTVAITRELLKEGAQVNSEPHNSHDALWQACRRGSEDTVRLLLRWGADPKRYERENENALAEAARHGSPSLVKLLIDAGANVNGMAVVRNAADKGNIEAMRILIDAGANVNVEATTGYAFGMGPGEPLECAASHGHEDVVRLLLEAGIDVNYVFPHHSESTKGETALIKARNEATALMLLDAGVNIHYDQWRRGGASVAMVKAASSGMLKLMKRALDAGASPNGSTPYQGSLLNIAAGSGESEAVSLLLHHGADIRYGGDSTKIPLHAAVEIVSDGLMKMLDPAREKRKIGVAMLLLDHKADIKATTSPSGDTALHVAAATGSGPGVLLLLERGADIEAQDKHGQTPLHRAAREGHLPVVEVLLDRGAIVNTRDKEGWTPVHRAAWNKYNEAVKLLGSRGADLRAETDTGLTVRDLLVAKAETSSGEVVDEDGDGDED